jgi:hypothetical protein
MTTEKIKNFQLLLILFKLWKVAAEQQPLIHKQVLLYYNITDASLDDIPPLNRQLPGVLSNL